MIQLLHTAETAPTAHTPIHMALESSTLTRMWRRESDPAEWHISAAEMTVMCRHPGTAHMYYCIISSTYFSFVIAGWFNPHHRKSHRLGSETGCNNKDVRGCISVSGLNKLTFAWKAKCKHVLSEYGPKIWSYVGITVLFLHYSYFQILPYTAFVLE